MKTLITFASLFLRYPFEHLCSPPIPGNQTFRYAMLYIGKGIQMGIQETSSSPPIPGPLVKMESKNRVHLHLS